MRCKVCDGALVHVWNNPKAIAGAQDFDNPKMIDLKLAQCQGCGLLQMTNEPVSYYKTAIRTDPWMTEPWRIKELTDFMYEFKLHGKKVELIDEEPIRGPFDAFWILNYLEHFPYPRTILRQLHANLLTDGVGLVEVPNFDFIYENSIYSEMIIDHLFFFTKKTLDFALTSCGFEVIKWNTYLDNFILSATVKKRKPVDMARFKDQERILLSQLVNFLSKYNKVALWSAGHQAMSLLVHLAPFGKIDYVVDSADFKQGRRTAVTDLPIVAPEHLYKDTPDAIIIIVGGFYESAIRQVRQMQLTPQPDLAVIKVVDLEIL